MRALSLHLSLVLSLNPAVFAEDTADDAVKNEERLLSSVRQLTFAGKRAGEGYFSADGKKMIFQSERSKDNPFFQIYLLDLETGDTQRISPGHGKTTCAWIHPSGKKVMFASLSLKLYLNFTSSASGISPTRSANRSATSRVPS